VFINNKKLAKTSSSFWYFFNNLDWGENRQCEYSWVQLIAELGESVAHTGRNLKGLVLIAFQ